MGTSVHSPENQQNAEQTNIDGASTDVDDLVDLHSTGHDKCGTSIDEQVNCKVGDGLLLPSAMNHSSGTETQPKSKDADPKIRNVTHGFILYNVPETLEGDPRGEQDSRCQSHQRNI